MEKPGMMIYYDMQESIEELTPVEQAMVYHDLFTYSRTGIEPHWPEKMAWSWGMFKARVDEDTARYERVSEKRREAARARWAGREERRAEESGEEKMHMQPNTKTNAATATESDTDSKTTTVSNTAANALTETTGCAPAKAAPAAHPAQSSAPIDLSAGASVSREAAASAFPKLAAVPPMPGEMPKPSFAAPSAGNSGREVTQRLAQLMEQEHARQRARATAQKSGTGYKTRPGGNDIQKNTGQYR